MLARLLRRWGWLGVLAVGGPALAGYLAVPAGQAQSGVYDVFAFLSAGAILTGIAIHRPERRLEWVGLAVGITLWAIGDTTFDYVTANGTVFPSASDAFYLGGEVLMAIALAALAKPGLRAIWPIVDAALITTAAGILAWPSLMQPILAASTSPLDALVAVGYPLLDVALIGVVALHLMGPGGRTPTTWLIAAGFACWLVSDIAYASLSVSDTYVAGTPLDLGWLGGYLLIAAGALHPAMRRSFGTGAVQRMSNRRIAILVPALAVPLVALAVDRVDSAADYGAAVVGSVVLGALIVARLVGALVASRHLLDEAMALRKRLEDQALTDALTGLPNRSAFKTRLAHLLGGSEPVAVFMLDLDGFKRVNDTWGHAVGDELLVAVTGRLSDAMRGNDLVARLGGDEFAILVAPGSAGVAKVVAERALRAFDGEFLLSGARIQIHPSLGIAIAPPGGNAEALVRNADVAMYDAKRRGGNTFEIFQANAHGLVIEGYRLANEIGRAIDDDQLALVYQPIIDLLTNEPAGVEALMRWHHPSRGLLSPATFIPIAESIGLIGPLDRWALRTACAQARAWADAGIWSAGMRLHVNVSPYHLSDPAVPDVVQVAIEEADIEPGWLTIEVTESALLDNDAIQANLRALAALGVGLSLDDFGTHYAVLAALCNLQFTTIKLDRSLVVGLADRTRAKMIHGIVNLVETLGLEPIAEGIETDEQARLAVQAGCRLGQGYLLGRPADPDAIGRMLMRAASASLDLAIGA